MNEYSRHFTVWRFQSPLSGEVAIVAQPSEPRDRDCQHEYQRILWSGVANSRAHALELSKVLA